MSHQGATRGSFIISKAEVGREDTHKKLFLFPTGSNSEAGLNRLRKGCLDWFYLTLGNRVIPIRLVPGPAVLGAGREPKPQRGDYTAEFALIGPDMKESCTGKLFTSPMNDWSLAGHLLKVKQSPKPHSPWNTKSMLSEKKHMRCHQ